MVAYATIIVYALTMFERCLYFNTHNLARTVNRIWTEEFRQYDLTPAHAYLLRLVLAEPGLLQRDIAENLGLSKSTITRFIDSLEQRDFVSRKFTGNDARESAIYPNRKAKSLQSRLEKSGQKLYQQMISLLGADSMKSTVANMRNIRDLLEKE